MSVPDLSVRERFAVETLYKEFQRVQAKSAATDDWFFRFLSIAVVPFLVFLAYSLATPAYRLFVAALPVLSLIGVLVVGVLTSHYVYANTYGAYLQQRINVVLGVDVMRDVRFGPAAYNGFTPVTISYGFGLLLLVALNVLVVPIIDDTVDAFRAAHAARLGPAVVVLAYYWEIVGVAVVVVIAATVTSFLVTVKRLRDVLTDENPWLRP